MSLNQKYLKQLKFLGLLLLIPFGLFADLNLVPEQDRDRVVIVCISGRGAVSGGPITGHLPEPLKGLLERNSAPPGMKNMRDKLRQELAPFGVSPDNIFHISFNSSASDDPFAQPDVGNIVDEIYRKVPNPSYVALIGHSYGGWAACRVSKKLQLPPNFIGLIDPVFGPDNSLESKDYPVGIKICNRFQDNAILILDACQGRDFPGNYIKVGTAGISMGYQNIEGADNRRVSKKTDWNGYNQRVKCFSQGRKQIPASHVNIDDSAGIWREYFEVIKSNLIESFSPDTPALPSVTFTPIVIESPEGCLHLIVQAEEKQYHFWQHPVEGWKFNGLIDSGFIIPKVFYGPDENLQIIASKGNKLVHYWLDRNTNVWSKATEVGDGNSFSGNYLYDSEGRLQLITTNGDKIVHFWFDFSSGWARNELGTGFTAFNASALYDSQGHMQVVAKKGDKVVHFSQDPSTGWTQGTDVGHGITSNPELLNGPDGLLQIVARRGDSIVHYFKGPEGWGETIVGVGDIGSSDPFGWFPPETFYAPNGNLQVISEKWNGKTLHFSLEPGSGWIRAELDGDHPKHLFDSKGVLHVLAKRDHRIVHFWRDPSFGWAAGAVLGNDIWSNEFQVLGTPDGSMHILAFKDRKLDHFQFTPGKGWKESPLFGSGIQTAAFFIGPDGLLQIIAVRDNKVAHFWLHPSEGWKDNGNLTR